MNDVERAYQGLKNVVWLREKVVIRQSVARVYVFLTTQIPAHYKAMSEGHEKFDVIGGGPLVEGAEIDCRERVKNQEVHHRYVVQKLIPNTLVYYVSKGSKSYVYLNGRTIEGSSNTHVSYELKALPDGNTEVTMVIGIQLESWWTKFIAKLLGRVEVVWKAHQSEELLKLVSLVEAFGDKTLGLNPVVGAH